MPEWVGTLLFFAAVGLSASKLNRDFGERGIWGFLVLMLLIAVYAAAIGFAYV